MPLTPARPYRSEADRPSRRLSEEPGDDPFSDPDALARRARARLAEGDGDGAFALADRRCRIITPGAGDFYLRAQSHRAAGRMGAAQRDLAAALALDPTDAALDAAALAWGDDALRAEAAERVIERAGSSTALRREAIAARFAGGAGAAHRLRRRPDGVSGWIAWTGRGPLPISVADADGARGFEVEPDPDHPLAGPGVFAAEIAIEAASAGPLSLTLGSGAAAEVFAPAPEGARPSAMREPHAPVPGDDPPLVTVIVPVYEDFEATRACLEALRESPPPFACRVIAVDDASPNPRLRAWLDEEAAKGAFTLLRNAANLGFAASVNRALARRAGGDALLLNADALPPPGLVARLRALSRSAPGVGAITPLSNNGELTSYPVRNEANPLPSAEAVAALDARARAVNGDALVDAPNGVGFCLYLTDACLEAVGALPEVYGRGYFEDVEFSLSARERGFRNVVAPGVFVGHAGSRSFSSSKRSLAARNLPLLEARFPGYRVEAAAFDALDPLRPYRAALDFAAPPRGPVTLVACGPGAAGRRRPRRLAEDDPDAVVLTLIADRRGRTRLSAAGGGAPQSLVFDNDARGAGDLGNYLARLDVRRVEWRDPASLPEATFAALLALDAEFDLMCGDFAAFAVPPASASGRCPAPRSPGPCESCRDRAATGQDEAERHRRFRLGRALERTRRVVPLDRLAGRFAERVFKARAAAFEGPARPPARPSRGRIERLGALCPTKSSAVDRLLLRLARRLAAEGGALFVLGGTLDDAALMATEAAFVTGPVEQEDLVDLSRALGVEALLAPDRAGGYGDLEAAADALGAPLAYFDWSFGAFAAEVPDLSLDPRICDEKAAAAIVAWMNGEPQS